MGEEFPVRKLWDGFNPNFKLGLFVILRGYVDESYSGELPAPNIFATLAETLRPRSLAPDCSDALHIRERLF